MTTGAGAAPSAFSSRIVTVSTYSTSVRPPPATSVYVVLVTVPTLNPISAIASGGPTLMDTGFSPFIASLLLA